MKGCCGDSDLMAFTVSSIEWRAGATDVQDRRHRGVSVGPVRDIEPTPQRTTIQWLADGGVRIGSLVRVGTVATDAAIRAAYRGLSAAAGGLAAPQIRAVATVGGALAQRSRCWYFRQPLFDCFKKGGHTCPARDGDHRLGVLIDLGPCVWPHPSTLGVALMAYDAVVDTSRGRRLTMADLFGDGSMAASDHLLEPDELIEAATIPAPSAGEQAGYLRGIARSAAEWPLVEVVIRLWVSDSVVKDVVIAVGAVANVPIRLTSAETVLRGCPVTDIRARVENVTISGTHLKTTAYKQRLLRGCLAAVAEQALVPEPAAPVEGLALEWRL
jgi:xanthine dehydrogenase YagS FAD-binding subunit